MSQPVSNTNISHWNQKERRLDGKQTLLKCVINRTWQRKCLSAQEPCLPIRTLQTKIFHQSPEGHMGHMTASLETTGYPQYSRCFEKIRNMPCNTELHTKTKFYAPSQALQETGITYSYTSNDAGITPIENCETAGAHREQYASPSDVLWCVFFVYYMNINKYELLMQTPHTTIAFRDCHQIWIHSQVRGMVAHILVPEKRRWF